MSHIVVDVETHGPSPFNGLMLSFEAICVSNISKIFNGQTNWLQIFTIPETNKIVGISKEDYEGYDEPAKLMMEFSNSLAR